MRAWLTKMAAIVDLIDASTARAIYARGSKDYLPNFRFTNAHDWCRAIAVAGRLGLSRLSVVVIDNSDGAPWPGGIGSRFAVEGWRTAVVDGRRNNHHASVTPPHNNNTAATNKTQRQPWTVAVGVMEQRPSLSAARPCDPP